MRRLVSAFALAALMLAACTSKTVIVNGSPASTGARQSPVVPSSSPALVPQPLSQARLEGKWNVQLFVRSSNFASHPQTKQRGWGFQPLCSTGACDSILRGQVNFAPDAQRAQAGARQNFRVRMVKLSTSYGGRVTGFFASCGSTASKDTWTFSIKVTDAQYFGDQWVATKWEGTWTRNAPFGTCTPGHLQAVIRGALSHP